MRGIRIKTLFIVLCTACCISFATADPIGRHPDNPHYFIYKGKPLVLITTDQHYGAVINADFDYIPFLDRLAEFGMNLTRIYPGGYIEIMGQYTKGNPLGPAPDRFILPWRKTAEKGASPAIGGYKYDLDRWDPEYFVRLKDFVYQASLRNIIVEIAFFNGMYDDRWSAQPLYNTNNIQGVGRCEFRQFTTLADKELVKRQLRYVRKIASELYRFDNIIYDISDEPEMQGQNSWAWNSTLLDALIKADKYRHLYGETARSASPDFTGDNRTSWIPTEYISPLENVLDNDYPDNKPIVNVESTYFPFWYGSDPEAESRAEGWYCMLGGAAGSIHLNSDFSVMNPGGAGTDTQSKILPQKQILMSFMGSLDYIRMSKFTGFSVSTAGAEARGIAEAGKQYALYLFHGTRKWEEWPQGQTASRLNVETGNFRDTLRLDATPGKYRIEWVDPSSGVVAESSLKDWAGGNLVLVTPEYRCDIALRIKGIADSR
jgi:hypothetical protein